MNQIKVSPRIAVYELDYPPEKMEVIVIIDGSTDKTAEMLYVIKDNRLKLIERKERGGKTNALNVGIQETKGEVIVFSDANSIYERSALKMLVKNFADKKVGYVTGRMVNAKQSECLISKGTSSYISYENILRKMESSVNSIVGCDGGIDAIRKDLCCYMEDHIIPDFYLPLKVVEQGYRVIYEPKAVSAEKTLEKTSNEFRMRVRVIVRTFNAIFHMKHLLNPIKYPFFSFQFLSHKVFRYLVPFAQIALFVINLSLVGNSFFYNILFFYQALFYLAALYGCLIAARGLTPSKFFYLPYYFNLVNFASLIAVFKYFAGERYVTWKPREG